jgi:DNA-binding GntR family transcriptional regulator
VWEGIHFPAGQKKMSNQQVTQGRASQTEDVYERLRAAILAGQYLPDQKLKIGELCDQVQGSLGAVREALSRLLSEGLVFSEAFKGFYVAPVSPADLIQVTRARIEIEKLCLTSSLANGDLEWEGRLIALLHQMLRLSPLDPMDNPVGEWWRLHIAFHDALVSACDNSWLLRMHRMLHEQSERYRRLALIVDSDPASRSVRARRDTVTQHKQLVEAALARDAGRAGEIIEAHLLGTTEYLLLQLGDGALANRIKRADPAEIVAGEQLADPHHSDVE